MCSTLFISTQKNKTATRLPIPLDPTYLCKEQPDAIREKKSEELDENNQKLLQKIVGKFLHYSRFIDPKMLISLNSLVEVQNISHNY